MEDKTARLPKQDQAQLAENSARAVEARRRRLAWRNCLQLRIDGGETLSDIVESAQNDPCLRRERVLKMLCALKGVGQKKAKRMMEEARISENRRVGGLGTRQIRVLEEAVSSRYQQSRTPRGKRAVGHGR